MVIPGYTEINLRIPQKAIVFKFDVLLTDRKTQTLHNKPIKPF
jgi:hypothetical protein